ncbi:hypothetical protein PHMEG_00033270 [Phytophthora megakarya]|uniref:Uncharacterized protein n=1 Tax=Phytophthora megakarya TaxID=4795 RepID=A0A225UU11_9STRA|nr:hypothetical protein PHMEG_00033270 [Phytophthora megakarya]
MSAVSDTEYKDPFRITTGEMTLLAHYLKISAVVQTHEGVQSTAWEALAMCFRRLGYLKRWIDIAGMFGRAPSTLFSIFYYVVESLDENLASFLFYNTSWICNNISLLCSGSECVCGVCGIGGTIRPICCASKGQQAVYNRHKCGHALTFQTVVIRTAASPTSLVLWIVGAMSCS